MPLFEISEDGLNSVDQTQFEIESLYERQDIQRLIRENTDVFGESLFLIAEEFAGWMDSSKRIDLLCIDKDANLVVIELKRNQTGSHMELQALRYAAMVSSMTFDQIVAAHAQFLNRATPPIEKAREAIVEFLGWDEVDEEQVALDVRLILASADFGKELTTSVMWLIDRGIDIRCIRLTPYKLCDGKLLIDIQQLIPLPEASAFQTKIGEKRRAERQNQTERHRLRYDFWDSLIAIARESGGTHANRNPVKDNWLGGGIGKTGFSLNYVVREQENQVELFIGLGKNRKEDNKKAFDYLAERKDEIERVFGESLIWERLPERDGSRVRFVMDGGYRRDRETWESFQPEMVERMSQLEQAFRPHVHALEI